MLFINCLQLDDPQHDKTLRGHTRYHPSTMKHVARNLPRNQLKMLAKAYDKWYEDADGGNDKDLVIVTPIGSRPIIDIALPA